MAFAWLGGVRMGVRIWRLHLQSKPLGAQFFELKSSPASDLKSNHHDFQRFQKGVGGRGLATNRPPKRSPKVLQKCVPILLRGHRKKGTEKRPESLANEGFPRANPLCPPTPFRNFWDLQPSCPRISLAILVAISLALCDFKVLQIEIAASLIYDLSIYEQASPRHRWRWRGPPSHSGRGTSICRIGVKTCVSGSIS